MKSISVLIALFALAASACAQPATPPLINCPIIYPAGPQAAPEVKVVAGHLVLVSWEKPRDNDAVGMLLAYLPVDGGKPQVLALPILPHARLSLPKGVYFVAVAYQLAHTRSEWSPAAMVRVPGVPPTP